MACCLCNDPKWVSVDTTYYFDMQLIEDLHWRLNNTSAIDTDALAEMIGLLESFQLVKDSIHKVLVSYHTRCVCVCPSCGHSTKPLVDDDQDMIIKYATQYYSGLTEEQWRVLNKLSNSISEMKTINNMVGMQSIKREFVRLLKFLASIDPEELKKNSHLMHMVITGPPGHGKTEIAKLLGNAFKKSGLLTSEKFVLATRADLIGMYCGHTAVQTTKMFDKARGGVIFIDEVYSLGNPEHGDVFTGECINTINQLLSERSDTLCIIAGYEDEISSSFFSYNPGLERRFPWRFNIKPYSEQDLVAIFHKKLKDIGYSADSDALLASDIKKDTFPNAGGDIANLVTNCMLSYYENLFMQGGRSRPINRADVVSGLIRYNENRKKEVVDPGPPFGMFS